MGGQWSWTTRVAQQKSWQRVGSRSAVSQWNDPQFERAHHFSHLSTACQHAHAQHVHHTAAPGETLTTYPHSLLIPFPLSPSGPTVLLRFLSFVMPALSVYLAATRPRVMAVTLCAMSVGGAIAFVDSPDNFSFFNFFVSLLGALLSHAGSNLINTYGDYQKGFDKNDTADDRSLVDGLLTPQQVYRAIVCFVLSSAAVAAYVARNIVMRDTAPFAVLSPLADFVLLVGCGFLLGYAYTGPPFYLKYKGLGDILILLGYGPFLVSGAYFCQHSCLPGVRSLWFSLAPGLLTEAILHANNTRDLDWDTKCGAVTLPQRLGPQLSRVWFIALYVLTLTTTVLPALAPHIFLPPVSNSSGSDGGWHWTQLLFLTPLLLLPTIIDLVRRYDNKQYKDICDRCGDLAAKFGALETMALVAWRLSHATK